MLTLLMRRVCLIQSLFAEKRSGVLCLVDEYEKLVDLIAANDPEGEWQRKRCTTVLHIESSLDLTERRRAEIDTRVAAEIGNMHKMAQAAFVGCSYRSCGAPFFPQGLHRRLVDMPGTTHQYLYHLNRK